MPLLILLLYALFAAPAMAAVSSHEPRALLFVLLRQPVDMHAATLTARVADFERRTATTRHELSAALPSVLAQQTRFEALPALNAWLVSVPGTMAVAAHSSLASVQQVAEVELHGTADPLADSVPGTLAPPRHAAPSTPATLTLGLIDLGLDVSHPLLAHTLGRLHFQPGTPGADGSGRLMRSHGTAMAGVIAQLVQGMTLTTGDVTQPWLTLPHAVAVGDTLVAHAGPETRAGRSDLLRALNWMMLPDRAHPRPDVINYSQGNGRLCVNACRHRPWTAVTRVIDRLIDEEGVSVVKSAGNRGYGADNTMTVPGDTWNGITVGNMHAFDWHRCAPGSDRRTHKIYRTSSVAPAAGERRLLDLVAPGVRVLTTGVDPAYCRQQCGQRDDLSCRFCPRLGTRDPIRDGYWKTNSGTSPAAAIVSAVALSLIDAGLRDPRAVKAVLINSADAWTSAGTPHPQTRGDGRGCTADSRAARHQAYAYGSHYDRSYGYGYLNPARAAATRAYTQIDSVTPVQAHCYSARLEPWDKLTLVWHRHTGDGSGLPLTPLRLALFDAVDRTRLDEDGARRLDNVRQVSNGRGERATPRARKVVVRVTAAAGERYALASLRPLRRLPACPTP